MLVTILFSLGVLAFFVLSMSIGLIFKGREIKGTCASKTALLYGEGAVCSVCGKFPGSCDTEEEKLKEKAVVSN